MLLYSPSLPFVRFLEQNVERIRDEAERIEPQRWRRASAEPLRALWIHSRDPSWRVASACAANALSCPRTARLLRRIPGLIRGGIAQLPPGAELLPGGDDDPVASVRCHLALDPGPRVFLRVKQRSRAWMEGRCVVLDAQSTLEPSAPGAPPRLVCVVDVERAALLQEIA